MSQTIVYSDGTTETISITTQGHMVAAAQNFRIMPADMTFASACGCHVLGIWYKRAGIVPGVISWQLLMGRIDWHPANITPLVNMLPPCTCV